MEARSRPRRFRFIAAAVVALAALVIASPAASNPTNNPNALRFTVTCPGMDPFNVTVVGAVGFADGLLTIPQATATQGSLTLVECVATNPQLGSQTVFLQLVERGGS